MNSVLTHRGPDADGLKIFNNIGLAHKRLSILDLEKGNQPISNEDGNIWLTFNGEIYNFYEKKDELEKKGHVFSTNCDTEIIVHLYEEYGKNCILHLDGMFAFALIDLNNNYALLARDRMGQKPLYYFCSSNLLIFASELQGLIQHPELSKEINQQSFHDYLSLQYIPAPYTIFNNVFKLKPAHYMEINLQKPNDKRIKPYWKCVFDRKIDISYEEAKEELRFLLKKAVKKRMMSDVPLGTFLSGGIDSTVITALMAEINQEPINTFTIGFDEEKYDERYFARITSEKFNTNHNEKLAETTDFSVVEQLVKNCGEPFADSSIFPTFILSRFAKSNIKVALSGDGADELFGGYYRYLVYYHSLKTDFLPLKTKQTLEKFISACLPYPKNERSFSGKLNRVLKTLSTSQQYRYLEIINRVSEEQKQLLESKTFLPTQNYFDKILNKATAENSIEKLMELDIHSYLPNDILTKIDISSMSNSLELRSPFMDSEVVEFINSLPIEYKLKGNRSKRILIDTFENTIPPQLKNRNKMGFGVPISDWLRNKWKSKTKELLLDGKGSKQLNLSKKYIEEIIKDHNKEITDNSYLLWSLIIFELWYDKFIGK